MSTCSNCKKTLSCGCQKRTASNGQSGCASCIGTLEAAAKMIKPVPTNMLYQKK